MARQALGRQIAVELLIVIGIGVALAALGPFGSYSLPLTSRGLLWIAGGVTAYAIIRPMTPAGEWLARRLRLPGLVGYGIVLSLAALPITLLLDATLNTLRVPPSSSRGAVSLYGQVWLIGLAIHLFAKRLLRSGPPAAGAEPLAVPCPPEPIPAPRLLARLPAGFGERVLCLEMEDHYVRVHGQSGSTLLLMRLGDAIAELDGIDGLQVHRSWWVERGAIARIRRDNRAVRIELENGVTVPVARSYTAALKSTGWGEKAAA